jgi:putative ABC transport system permease protein
VGPTYFQTLQLPIVAGRSFTSVDAAESALVCIVNEAFVRRYAAGRDPISLRVTTAAIVGNVAREIVGVARQVKGTADERQDLAQIYVPNAQVPYAEAFLLVSPTHGRTDVLANAVRAAIARVDREQPVRRVVTCAGRA